MEIGWKDKLKWENWLKGLRRNEKKVLTTKQAEIIVSELSLHSLVPCRLEYIQDLEKNIEHLEQIIEEL